MCKSCKSSNTTTTITTVPSTSTFSVGLTKLIPKFNVNNELLKNAAIFGVGVFVISAGIDYLTNYNKVRHPGEKTDYDKIDDCRKETMINYVDLGYYLTWPFSSFLRKAWVNWSTPKEVECNCAVCNHK